MLLEEHVARLVAPHIPPDWVHVDADEEDDASAGAAAPPDPADDANGDDPAAAAGAPGPQAPADASAGVRGGKKKRKKRARSLAAAFARAEPGTALPVGDGAPPGATAEDGDGRETDPAGGANEALAVNGDVAPAKKRRKRKEDASTWVDV
jgi:hypothetical protein